MIAAVLLSFVLVGHLPAFEASDTCGVPSLAPEDHISYLKCFDANGDALVSIFDSSAMVPGAPFTWVVEAFGQRNVYVRAYDERDNESCKTPTKFVDGGPPPNVGVPGVLIVQREYFDITGRRIARPKRTGVYFERTIRADGSSTRRILVVK